MNYKILSALALCGCSQLNVKEQQTPISDNIPNKILNTVTVEYNEKPIFDLKANSHKDPNLKGDLIRQEYFINIDF
jgi:hypothetical protein